MSESDIGVCTGPALARMMCVRCGMETLHKGTRCVLCGQSRTRFVLKAGKKLDYTVSRKARTKQKAPAAGTGAR